jgi:predicted porin
MTKPYGTPVSKLVSLASPLVVLTDDQGMDEDQTTWNAGVRYATGPWGVGVQYTNGENDATDGEVEAVEIGGSYAFGPGMLVMAGVQFWDNDGWSSTSDGDSTIVFLGTHVSF